MTPELQKMYEESYRPFVEGGGAITPEQTKMRSWRYFLEINSACNLKCPSCTKGNMSGYDHKTGIMDPELMEKCIEKIRNENNQAIVFLYGNSEPFLHPRLPECIAMVKKYGLRCEMSSNLNYIQRVDETLAAGLDFMIISLSGFTQEVYVKGHDGGQIDNVKKNMRIIGEANAKLADPVTISVNYHVYKDNGGAELDSMRAYASECGIGFFTSTARAISMENSIQYLREKEGNPPYEVQEGWPDFNQILPPPSQQWRDTMDRLKIPPQNAREMYSKYPDSKLCPVGAGAMFTFIRHDGLTSLCACVADRRITVGPYLSTNVDEMVERRVNHSICQFCTKYKLNMYYHLVDRDRWDPL